MKKYVEGIEPLDQKAMDIARKYHNTLVKPEGSLGRLEDIAIQIAGITGKVKNKTDKKILFLLGADARNAANELLIQMGMDSNILPVDAESSKIQSIMINAYSNGISGIIYKMKINLLMN